MKMFCLRSMKVLILIQGAMGFFPIITPKHKKVWQLIKILGYLFFKAN